MQTPFCDAAVEKCMLKNPFSYCFFCVVIFPSAVFKGTESPDRFDKWFHVHCTV